MQINRRHALKAFVSGVAASLTCRASARRCPSAKLRGPRSLRLSNGFRVHYIPNDSGYVAATLVLRSKEITHNGLAHICEHTSCVGAAGYMTAAEVARMNKDYVQDGNASTEAGHAQVACVVPAAVPAAGDAPAGGRPRSTRSSISKRSRRSARRPRGAVSRQIRPRQARPVQIRPRAVRPFASVRQRDAARGNRPLQDPAGQACRRSCATLPPPFACRPTWIFSSSAASSPTPSAS